MESPEQPEPAAAGGAAAEDERRREQRLPFRQPVRLVIDAQSIESEGTNLSSNGLLVTARGELRVQVEFERNGRPCVARGRLVRAQRLKAGETGLAVEFDAPLA